MDEKKNSGQKLNTPIRKDKTQQRGGEAFIGGKEKDLTGLYDGGTVTFRGR